MNETVVNDPLLRLIEWHSNAGAGLSPASGNVESLDTLDAVEAALVEWHEQRGAERA